MAPGSGSGLKIVQTWTNHGAPTGEGGRYQTEDGAVWKDHVGPETVVTGRRYADVRYDRMVPR